MTGTLKVTPEKLTSTAQEFSTKGATVSKLTSEMTSIVTSLSSIWEGEASSAFINKFKGLDNDIQLLNKMIQEHAKDLQTMSTTYATAEKESVAQAQALSNNIIS